MFPLAKVPKGITFYFQVPKGQLSLDNHYGFLMTDWEALDFHTHIKLNF